MRLLSHTPGSGPLPELWGGVECTINRAGDEYYDQLELSGHYERPEDLDLAASLGIKALRFPVLWEKTMPEGAETADWAWADDRLERVRSLGVRPIVGLVHHGSGPRDTSLLDPAFPGRLATYARAVAERYPWVEDYTPVNEPLTTARFACLYGHWYPHAQDPLAFARALLIESRATVEAMRAIREVNPQARLVQTEDLGRTTSTRPLQYQADFENERRWLSLDLITGTLTRDKRMWQYLTWLGIPEADLEWFLENPMPPDVIGLNYYLTSERFLDHRLNKYPATVHGGNGRDSYADVEAVRALPKGIGGPGLAIRDTWERYGLPVAITEAHLGCTREEQMRWLVEVWDQAERARKAGADVRAVTVWSLLGAYDWNSLLTRRAGHYEPGIFDVRSGKPRETALAGVARDLAAGRRPEHPVLPGPGWWRRPERLLYARSRARLKSPGERRPLLIVGASGTLGRAFARICELRGLEHVLLSRQDMDITSPDSVRAAVRELQPWAIVNAAGFVRVDDAESEEEECWRANTIGPAVLARECAAHGARFLTFSSDLVFDGEKGRPYLESDEASPLSAYGRSKAEAERRVLEEAPGALVVRTSAFFGPWDEHNFVHHVLATLAEGRSFVAAGDAVVSPTYVPDLVQASLDLLIDGAGGLWHLANPDEVTWAELARCAALMNHLDPALVEERPLAEMGWPAARPHYSALGSEHGRMLPELDDALWRYARDTGRLRAA